MPGAIGKIKATSEIQESALTFGDMYIMDVSASEDPNALKRWTGTGWETYYPALGWICYIEGPPEELLLWNGEAWEEVTFSSLLWHFDDFVIDEGSVPLYEGEDKVYANETLKELYVSLETGVQTVDVVDYKLFLNKADDFYYYYKPDTQEWIRLFTGEVDLSDYALITDLNDYLKIEDFHGEDFLLKGDAHLCQYIKPTSTQTTLTLNTAIANVFYIDVSDMTKDFINTNDFRMVVVRNSNIEERNIVGETDLLSQTVMILFTGDSDVWGGSDNAIRNFLFGSYRVEDDVELDSGYRKVAWVYGNHPGTAYDHVGPNNMMLSMITINNGAKWYGNFLGQYEDPAYDVNWDGIADGM